jgi:hypothetical protein
MNGQFVVASSLAKAKRSEFKDVLLDKVNIPNYGEKSMRRVKRERFSWKMKILMRWTIQS